MESVKKNILILGADGFIGSNFAVSLLKNKAYNIKVFDLFKNNQTKNLEKVRGEIEIISGNFLNRNDLMEALRGVDYVFHFISLTTPGSSRLEPIIDIETNIKGTVVLLEECVKANVKKIIFPSSGGAIYGDNGKSVCSEKDQTDPVSPYAISKLTIEKYLEYFRINYGLEYLILRYSNPYGPGQNISGSQGIIPIFLGLIKENKPITVFGDGENIRDYIYIDDLVEATKSLAFKDTNYRLYNVGSGEGRSINEILDILKQVTNRDFVINHVKERSVDVKANILDISRLKSEIDFSPKTTIKEGITKTWEWVNSI